MIKQWRAELRVLKKQQRAEARIFLARLKSMRREVDRTEKAFASGSDRRSRRIAILEGRLP